MPDQMPGRNRVQLHGGGHGILWNQSGGAAQAAAQPPAARPRCIASASAHFQHAGTMRPAFSQVLTATGFLAGGIFENDWDISGEIPDGMTFDDGFFPTSGGPTLTGTPTTTQSYTFTATVTNPNGDFMTKTFTITVFAAAATIVPIITAATPVT